MSLMATVRQKGAFDEQARRDTGDRPPQPRWAPWREAMPRGPRRMMVDDVITAPRAAQDAAPDVAPPSPWLVLSQSGRPEPRTTVDPRRIAIQIAATAALVILVVAVVGAVAARRMAEGEAIDDASRRADLIADAVLQPALSDGLLRGDPGALRTVDRVVRDRAIAEPVVRVKLRSADGPVLYSD